MPKIPTPRHAGRPSPVFPAAYEGVITPGIRDLPEYIPGMQLYKYGKKALGGDLALQQKDPWKVVAGGPVGLFTDNSDVLLETIPPVLDAMAVTKIAKTLGSKGKQFLNEYNKLTPQQKQAGFIDPNASVLPKEAPGGLQPPPSGHYAESVRYNAAFQVQGQAALNPNIPKEAGDLIAKVDVSKAKTPIEAAQKILDDLPESVRNNPDVSHTVKQWANQMQGISNYKNKLPPTQGFFDLEKDVSAQVNPINVPQGSKSDVLKAAAGAVGVGSTTLATNKNPSGKSRKNKTYGLQSPVPDENELGGFGQAIQNIMQILAGRPRSVAPFQTRNEGVSSPVPQTPLPGQIRSGQPQQPRQSVAQQAYQTFTGGVQQAGAQAGQSWNDLVEIGRKVAEQYGLHPSALVGQMSLETGRRVGPGQNMFGIKGTGPAGSNVLGTQEANQQGQLYGTQAGFRAYNTPQQSMEDYVKLLSTEPRYKKAWEVRSDPVKFVTEVKKAGYATDPNYVSKVINTPEFKKFLPTQQPTITPSVTKFPTPSVARRRL